MNFNVTCVCGQSFQVTIQQVNRLVTCPACNRALIPVVAEPVAQAGGAVPVSAAEEPTRRCPFCGEVILACAKKCKHCNEFLDRGAPEKTSAASLEQESPPVFTLSVSQWDNFWRYLTCLTALTIVIACLSLGSHYIAWVSKNAAPIFLVALIVAAIAGYISYLGAKRARCVIRANRIDTEVGIFSRKTDSVEMFRIKDIQLQQRFIQRILGIGTIVIQSTDETTPVLELYMIPQVRKVHKYLQEQIPKADAERKVLHIEP